MLGALHIEDEPSIANRGYYFDCARGRVPKLDWLKKLADRMAYYKMNQLQLYIEHSYLFRGMTELWRDDTPLTAEEIMEFDHYCNERGIELVPSCPASDISTSCCPRRNTSICASWRVLTKDRSLCRTECITTRSTRWIRKASG